MFDQRESQVYQRYTHNRDPTLSCGFMRNLFVEAPYVVAVFGTQLYVIHDLFYQHQPNATLFPLSDNIADGWVLVVRKIKEIVAFVNDFKDNSILLIPDAEFNGVIFFAVVRMNNHVGADFIHC